MSCWKLIVMRPVSMIVAWLPQRVALAVLDATAAVLWRGGRA